MFPQRFFFEATLIIALLSVAHFAMLMFAVNLLKKRFGARPDESGAAVEMPS
jgi:hypothetical protein